MKDVLVIEPFYGGSHAQLIDLLCSDDIIGPRVQLYTLSAKKWHWRARTAALYFSQVIEPNADFRLLFCSSVLNLSELAALRPDLARLIKVVYFHENQLLYPVQKQKERDFHYGYSQILTAMVADEVIFNSKYNQKSFLDSISHHLKLIPDHRPKHIAEKICPKSRVIYFPLTFINDKTSPVFENKLFHIASTSTSQQDRNEENPLVFNEASITIPSFQSHLKNSNVTITASNDELHTGKNEFVIASSSVNVRDAPNSIVKGDNDNIQANEILSQKCELSPKIKIPKFKNGSEVSTARAKTISSDECSHVKKCDSETHVSKDIKGYHDKLNEMESTEEEMTIPQAEKTVLPHQHPSLHIVWPHRWEHDKGPEAFFEALFQLQIDGFEFIVSVIGETFSQIPDIFQTAHSRLGHRIHAWGYQSREDYVNIIKSAHVVVSTADHEFFGVSMLEATNCGCFPLCPKRLVYPELYPDECLYATQAQLVKRLKQFCRRPDKITCPVEKIRMGQFSWQVLKEEYRELLLRGHATPQMVKIGSEY